MLIQEARLVLKKAGYFTDNLWNIEDVRNLMDDKDITDDEALDILESALCNELVVENIWFAIDVFAEQKKEKLTQ